MTSRRVLAACTTAALVGSVVAAGAAPATEPTARRAVVDTDLVQRLTTGPAPAVLTWDRHAATPDQISAHLARAGLRATVFNGLPVALACAAGAGDLGALASAPGALSVWADEDLQPATASSAGTVDHRSPPSVGSDLGVDGTGVSLAVVDTGLDGRHAAFAGRVRTNVRVVVSHREFLGPGDPPPCQDFYTAELEDSELTSGHGTHLAGVAAGDESASGGQVTGIAPGAQVVGVGISDSVVVDADVRDSTRLSMFGALAGLNYALVTGLDGEDPVKAVLAGWLGSGLQNPFHPISLAIRDLHDFGITVVLPVGNEGPAASDCSRAETCHVSPYAVGPFAVGVAAASASDTKKLADFSSRGDPELRNSEGYPVAYEPLLAAPGENVGGPRRVGTANVATPPGSVHGGGGSPTSDQSDPQHVAMSGTSVAAAHVAGAVVLMQQAALEASGCYLATRDVRRLLAETASPMPDHARSEAGAGLLDIAAAISAARAQEPPEKPTRFLCPRTTRGASS